MRINEKLTIAGNFRYSDRDRHEQKCSAERGKKQLDKVLNKILGAGENSSSDNQNQQSGETSQDQSSSASQIIDGIFKKIIK